MTIFDQSEITGITACHMKSKPSEEPFEGLLLGG